MRTLNEVLAEASRSRQAVTAESVMGPAKNHERGFCVGIFGADGYTRWQVVGRLRKRWVQV